MSKFIQIAAVHTQAYTQPNGELCWPSTTLYALDENGDVWEAAYLTGSGTEWIKLPKVEKQ